MGFFNAMGRFFRRLFGLGEGALSNASDKILTANESTIRAQFRKVRDKLMNDHATIRNALANLMAINEDKKHDISTLENKIKELETKKIGAVKKFKETNDLKYQDAFKDCHIQYQKAEEKLKINREFVAQSEENLDRYKRQLIALQGKIEDLKAQEDQAVADIISAREVTKLNEMLAGYSTDIDMQGISVIEEARKKALANAKLSTELTGTSKSDIDKELLEAGSSIDEEFSKMLAQEEKKMIKNTQEERRL
jgi:phage shock protein A